jgi:CheY-like chemotaxis protein
MSLRILVIDDSVTVRQAVMKFLTAEGYDVVTTSDAAKVLDIIKQIEPDLVISDIMMPEMDGYTFLRHVRREKSLGSLPVILMSAKKREAMQDLFAYEGVSGYLEKPFTQEQLTELIKKTLRQREKE